MKKCRYIALLLVAVLLFTGCDSLLELAAANVLGEDYARMNMTFSQMTYARPDMEELQRLVDDACVTALTDATAQEIMEKVYAYYDAYDNFGTMYRLADLRYSMDLTDEYYQTEYEFCTSQLSYVDSTLEDLYVELAKSPVVDELEEDYFSEDFFAPYQAPEGSDEDWEYDSIWDEEYMALNNREYDLLNRYYIAQDGLSSLDPNSGDYYDRYVEKMGPIYVELITIRQEIARYAGYKSYEDYANAWYYSRQTPAGEMDDYVQDIQTFLVPLYREVFGEDYWSWVTEKTITKEDCLNYLKSATDNMGSTLADAYEEMIQRELYDLTPSPNKAAGSYETYLTSFSAPFILVNPLQDMRDLLTFTHEFGHFANDYATYGTYASSDVAEVLSQGMEYLSLCYADNLSEEDMLHLRQTAMLQALGTYVDQMAYYTFEREAYRLKGEDLTVENLNAIYDQVAQDFGFDAVGWEPAEWTTIPHFFQSPFYVYGYVVSCDAAMQIYQMELETPGAGLKLFDQFLYEWEDLPLNDYLERYNLEDPLTPGRVDSVAKTFREIFDGITPLDNPSP